MFLHRLQVNPRCRDGRRDLADPYQMHATLCRAFSASDTRCPGGEFLWRLEPEADPSGCPRILVQSRSLPDWSRIEVKGWFEGEPNPALDLTTKLRLDALGPGDTFRFRIRANPCVTRNGRRLGILNLQDQEAWMRRKGEAHGFQIRSVQVAQEQMLRGKQHGGNPIRVFSALFDGYLSVGDPGAFREAIRSGIGHGKALGLGLLSVVPSR